MTWHRRLESDDVSTASSTILPSGRDTAWVGGLDTAAAIVRGAARDSLDADRKAELGQYFTPVWVARLLASMIDGTDRELRLLDPGAGAGTLFMATLAELLSRDERPRSVEVTAFEIDPGLRPYLERSEDLVREACREAEVDVKLDLRFEDFAEWASRCALGDLFSQSRSFDAAILNPPYGKLPSDSDLRKRLDRLGISAPNLYAAFLGLALECVRPGGTVAAIVPRSFCNGTYFTRFRRFLLDNASIRRLHLFHARDQAFVEDSVLQENVLVWLERDGPQGSIVLSFSDGQRGDPGWFREVPAEEVLHPDDPDRFIRLPPDPWSSALSSAIRGLPAGLDDLGLSVSTGPLVAFRSKESLTDAEEVPTRAVPLLYPLNLSESGVTWPVNGKKAQGLMHSDSTRRLLVPTDWYVVTKRFTSKEEPRRIVASVIDPATFPTDWIALENHLNFFHRNGSGLTRDEAVGLATYLNSTLVDEYFRQFSGHTQVNASDLKKLRYPSLSELRAMGRACESGARADHRADELIQAHNEELAGMPRENEVRRKIQEALQALVAIGVPKEQQNERSALTLLALLGLGPDDQWADAGSPLMGVTPIMEWARKHYDRQYAPNTRETFRRFTLHQFVDAGLVIPNPDEPTRPVNSPNYCYQIEPAALELLRSIGSADWNAALLEYKEKQEELREQYAQRRRMRKIQLEIKDGFEVTLTPGGQNELVKDVMEEFCPRYVPGGLPVYVGDAGQKWAYFDEELAEDLGIQVDQHGKMPDLVIYHPEKDWLVLIEAVTSHGPINPKRMRELKDLFASAAPGLVFVTAFEDRHTLLGYLNEIAWESEVWVAESPSHLLHFDGERFLGPYED